MRWKDLAFGKKLFLAFGSLVVLLLVISVMSYRGVSVIKEGVDRDGRIGELHDNFSQMIIDHYKWLEKVQTALLSEAGGRLDVETDHRNCRLGKWLHGKSRVETEAEFPAIAARLKAMENPHEQVHSSAKELQRLITERATMGEADFRRQAGEVFTKRTLPALTKVREILFEIQDDLEKDEIATCQALEKTVGGTKSKVMFIAVFAILVGIAFALVITRYITSQIDQLAEFAGKLGSGDFTARIGIDQKDEIGVLAGTLNSTTNKLSSMFAEIVDEVMNLSSASHTLDSVSEKMADGAEDMSGRSTSVAAAAEEMSVNMTSVAAASEEASTNVTMVAAATEEMTATVSEIASSSEQARTITTEAVEKARSASGKVTELGGAASEITKVTEVITEISEQTNLLALNATIEAARAGEAGKGFAVVANEIKDLARQTAEATLEIKEKVSGIQNSTSATSAEIEQIVGVINNVDEIVTTIATAVDQQAATTHEIAESVSQASLGIGEVNENVAQTSVVSTEIASDIAQVSQVADEIHTDSGEVRSAAKDLSAFAIRIKDMMGEFKVSASENNGKSALMARAVPDLIRWDNTIALGLADVDGQHRKLVEMINNLHRAMKTRQGRQTVGKILNGLVEYTVEHFRYEEQVMEKFGYVDLAGHRKQHKKLVAEVGAFADEFKAGKAMVSMDLMEFLKDWLVKHIQGTDRQYAPFFKENGVG